MRQRFSCFLFLAFITAVHSSDYVFENDFESFEKPQSDADIARFLTQASFGPTPATVGNFGNQTYAEWIDQQFSLTPTLHRPALESISLNRGINGKISGEQRAGLWNKIAITAEDQLRQRMAFALSEIFVVSDQNKFLEIRQTLVAEYYDLLVRGAFGNYRDLLEQVTRSPAMGYYLSHLRNRKKELVAPTTDTYVTPDENFAREVMQLFSIGLFEVEQDLSFIDGDPAQSGIQPIETYDQNIITNLSRVMTGFGLQCNGPEVITNGTVSVNMPGRDCKAGPETECEGVHCNFSFAFFGGPVPLPNANYNGLYHPDIYRPMMCFPRFHDIGRDDNGNPNQVRPSSAPYAEEPYRDKRVIGFIPNEGSGPLPMYGDECNSLYNLPSPTDTQLQKMQACVDYCDGELSQVLDALFHHPNTPPVIARQLIQRFVTSNPSPAYIKKIAGVFIDNGSGVRGDLGAVIKAILLHHDARGKRFKLDSYFGKLKEPMLKVMQFYRAMETVTSDPEQIAWGPYKTLNTTTAFGQRALSADSVFNFFTPDYKKSGTLSNENLNSPEFQILTDNTVISGQNTFYRLACTGYGFLSNNPPYRYSTCDGLGPTLPFGFHPPERAGYIPEDVLYGLPDDFEAMVEELNIRLLYGEMSGTFNPPTGMKGIFKNRIEGPTSGYDKRQIALTLINLILASPEYAAQK